jgi:hypothetical protein
MSREAFARPAEPTPRKTNKKAVYRDPDSTSFPDCGCASSSATERRLAWPEGFVIPGHVRGLRRTTLSRLYQELATLATFDKAAALGGPA